MSEDHAKPRKRPPELAKAREWMLTHYDVDYDEDDPTMASFCLGVYGVDLAMQRVAGHMQDVTLGVVSQAKQSIDKAVKPMDIVFKSVEQLKPMAEKLERLNREAKSNIDAMNRAAERLEAAAKAAAAGKRLLDKRSFWSRMFSE